MFTGLITSIGTLTSVARRGENLVFRVRAQPAFDDIQLGESIALDGYCQTVVAVDGPAFEVEVSPETAARTTAGARRAGDRLNLERALRVGDRLGGHVVAGHVDGVGDIRSIAEKGGFVVVAIAAPADILRYCVSKGSIAVDGISLTINAVDDTGMELGIIPHTWNATTLHERRRGDKVNVEADIIGKYIERFWSARFGEDSEKSRVTKGFLAEHGFLK
ncbi:MAG: riboflavin synthase [Candidatus Lernaella stagnicola]|nr:riboflavin synthase [Candidatus Lernaella stagnicola]